MNQSKRIHKDHSSNLEESTKKQFGIALGACLCLILAVAAFGGAVAYLHWSTITRLIA